MTRDRAEAHLRLAHSVAVAERLLVPALSVEIALEHLRADTLTDTEVRWVLREVYGRDVLTGRTL